jgi:hypothetical protein
LVNKEIKYTNEDIWVLMHDLVPGKEPLFLYDMFIFFRGTDYKLWSEKFKQYIATLKKYELKRDFPKHFKNIYEIVYKVSYEDLPIHMNESPDHTVLIQWRLRLGK